MGRFKENSLRLISYCRPATKFHPALTVHGMVSKRGMGLVVIRLRPMIPPLTRHRHRHNTQTFGRTFSSLIGDNAPQNQTQSQCSLTCAAALDLQPHGVDVPGSRHTLQSLFSWSPIGTSRPSCIMSGVAGVEGRKGDR